MMLVRKKENCDGAEAGEEGVHARNHTRDRNNMTCKQGRKTTKTHVAYFTGNIGFDKILQEHDKQRDETD